MIKFAYTILYVENADATVSFYENAFGFKRKFVSPGNEYGEIDTGSTTLSFASWEQAASNFNTPFNKSSLNEKPFGIEIAFTTDNVQATFDKAVAAGGTAFAEPAKKPHGQTVAYIRDPNGILIEICTEM